LQLVGVWNGMQYNKFAKDQEWGRWREKRNTRDSGRHKLQLQPVVSCCCCQLSQTIL